MPDPKLIQVYKAITANLQAMAPGGVAEIDIKHDEPCPVLKHHENSCSCQEVEVTATYRFVVHFQESGNQEGEKLIQ